MAATDSFRDLKQFIESGEFCNGKVSNTAYNTAWVARIRSKTNPGEPAFPKSLEWLRNHQLDDGSWGTTYPILVFERIVSTVIAVIVLKDWGLEADSLRIERGTDYIKNNLSHLQHKQELQDKMTIDFELILPCLIDEASSFGIEFGEEQIFQAYRKANKMKMDRIHFCKRNNINFTGVKSLGSTLEALQFLYSDEEVIEMVGENDLICCSYGATAYALFKGFKIVSSFRHISKVVSENNGGVPSLYRIDVFDLISSLNSLIFAGFKMNENILSAPINRLKKLWVGSKGMLGACVGLPPNADETANAIFVLSSIGCLFGIEALKCLMKFYRKNYFSTFGTEKHPSISTNINCLLALKNFQHYSDVRRITYKVYEWTKSEIIYQNYNIEDKCHYSSFYPLTRALLAFDYIDHEFSETIYKLFMDKQNSDGGWGSNGRSTYLESSYVIISVIYWLRNHQNLYNQKRLYSLKRARQFMSKYKGEFTPFWKDKTLYSPINVDKTSILAAKFALDQIIV